MTIKEREAEMFDELEEKSSEPIVRDGIVNEAAWQSMPIKCVFILKEAISDEAFHLCDDHLATGAGSSKVGNRHPTWWNVARWAYTIAHIDEDLDYRTQVKDKGSTRDNRIEWLSKIVAINVKKHGGESTTDTSELVESFKTYYSDFLPKQIRLYADADVIICCGDGVFDCLREVFYETFGEKFDRKKYLDFGKEERKFYILGTNDDYKGVFKKGTLIIDYWHPAAFKKHKMMNNLLRDIIRKELKRG